MNVSEKEQIIRNRELCEKYPFLLPYDAVDGQDSFDPRNDIIDSDFDYSFTMFDCVPKGWKSLFLSLCDEVRSYVEQHKDIEPFVRFVDIKEKWGALRMEISCGDKGLWDILTKYEKMSQTVCVSCGAPATRISRGWICPYCDRCIGDMQSDQIG